MVRFSIAAALFATSALVPGVGHAATITGWITDNVIVGPEDTDATDDVGGASVVYDQDVSDGDTTGALSYGQVTYIAPESNTPGIKIDLGDPAAPDGLAEGYIGAKNQEFDGCIMASSTAFCDSPFQSGKRIKQQVTGIGAIDLTFGVSDPEPDVDNEPSIYQVFHRLINVTGGELDGFTIELGTGVGDAFVASGADDGLSFAQDVAFGPDNLAAFSQYPFGLFGGDPLNPNPLQLPGFFDTEERAGFNVTLGEDVITSDGYYGSYDDLFANWLSQEDVPDGLLYDYDPGNADPLVMAWATDTGWEFLRSVSDDFSLNDLGVTPIESQFFDYDFDNDPENGLSASMFDYITENFAGLTIGENLLIDAIEDLANLNLTFALSIDDAFAFDSFTMRVTPTGSVIPSEVPLPAGGSLLISGLLAFGLIARRRRAV